MTNKQKKNMRLKSRLHAISLAVYVLCTFCALQDSKGATLITATITVTNTAAVGKTWIVNGNTRTWTNNSGSPVQSWITTGASVGATTTNLYNHIIRYPYSAPQLLVSLTTPTSIVLRGTSLSITTNNYTSVSWTTNTGATLDVVSVPFENLDYATNRTNHASWLVDALNRYPRTNWFLSNSVVMGQFLGKGASTQQVVTAPVQFNGLLRAAGAVAFTNGFTRTVTNINPVTSNLVNYGSAIRSEGIGGNSLQIGSNALATGTFATAIGNSALARTNYDVAIGVNSKATNGYGTAVGVDSVASAGGTAIGQQAEAIGSQSVALGSVAQAQSQAGISILSYVTTDALGGIGIGVDSGVDSYNGIAIGNNAYAYARNTIAIGGGAWAQHSNSAAIGPLDHAGNYVTTTTTNQIRLGTANHAVNIPGQLLVSGTQSNTTFTGRNIFQGSLSYPRYDLSTLAAGNNLAVPIGTNRYVRANSGPTDTVTISGIVGATATGGLDGQDVVIYNDTGTNIVFSVSTADPTPANRITTPTGSDITLTDQGWAQLVYDGTDSRWKVVNAWNGSIVAPSTGVFGGSGNGAYVWTGETVLTEGTASPIATVTLGDGKYAGVKVFATYTIVAGGNVTVGSMRWQSAVRHHSGTLTSNSSTPEHTYVGDHTPTATVSIVDATGAFTVNMNVDKGTSGDSTITTKWHLWLNTDEAPAVSPIP